MKKTIFKKLFGGADGDLFRDIGFLFVASCFVLVQLFDYPLQKAALVSPVLIVGLMIGLYLLVQTLWLLMVITDKINSLLNLKRSPLA